MLLLKKTRLFIQNFLYLTMTLLLLLSGSVLYAEGTGGRAAFTKGGWAGARYVGLGMTGEVMANDVYSMYWNPAGLTALKGKKKVSADEIEKKARSGNVDDIKESDLLNFSEDHEEGVVHIGASAAMLDVSRNAGFTGVAFNLFGGVGGVGLYSIMSLGIEERDEAGVSLGKTNYVAAASFFSYGWSMGLSSFGMSLKVLYEKIGDVSYMGAGCDLGTQVYVLPFLKVGFMVQDLGTGLIPAGSQENIETKYDLALPALRLGVALISDTGLTFAVSAIRKLEQEEYEINAGVEYDLIKYITIYLGVSSSQFSSGITVKMANLNISYAFTFDNIDYGMNNIASVSLLF